MSGRTSRATVPRATLAGVPAPADSAAPVDTVAALWAASDSQRALVLQLLARDSFGVSDLTDILAVPQPALSHHLKILSDAGWVTTRKEGANTFYRRAVIAPNEPLAALRGAVFDALDQRAFDSRILHRVAIVHDQRQQRSAAFFARHAAAFRQHQDQIIEPGAFIDSLQQLLDAAGPPDRRLAIEHGPGTGELLLWLAGRFRRVIGIDASAAMLAQARQRVRAAALKNVRLVLGDTESLTEQPKADALFTSMVLHHLPSPATFFTATRAALSPRGRLFLVELCPHQQDWTRECCGDLWLGFEPEELLVWAGAAGLQHLQAQYLTQRNGFRIQLHVFQENGTT